MSDAPYVMNQAGIDALQARAEAAEARVAKLTEALALAANRLQREAINYTPNSTGFSQVSEYAAEARAALQEKPHE